MSVNSYLNSLASNLVISPGEKSSISTSISTIGNRLDIYSETNNTQHFKFGSYTRGTILPRSADAGSDIDYMVVFSTDETTYKPQTYLNRLKRFVEKYYSRSEIHQDYPTIVLDLSHIKFELVPAIKPYTWSTTYKIPSPADDFLEWMDTDPTGFNQKLIDANTLYSYQVKPLVRLIKYWNIRKGRPFSSYSLENYIAGSYFGNCSNIRDCFYQFWNGWSLSYSWTQTTQNKVQSAKNKVAEIKSYEDESMPITAESKMKLFLPFS